MTQKPNEDAPLPAGRYFRSHREDAVEFLLITGNLFDMATDLALKETFFAAIRRAGTDPTVRVLLLVAGRDALGEARYGQFATALAQQGEAEILVHREENALCQFARLACGLEKLVVAGFGGSVIGQFLGAALATDYRIAAESTVFSFPHVRYETPPPAALAHFLPQYTGTAKAWQVMLGGKPISAAAASKLGLVDEIVPDDQLMEACVRKAKELAEVSPRVVTMWKRSKAVDLHGLDARSQVEAELHALYGTLKKTGTGRALA